MANVDRFWELLREDGECWVWTKGKYVSGYGGVRKDGRMQYTHRVAWELSVGPIPDGLHVLHVCDNPPCVRPSHLFLGRDAENHADMTSKGRASAPPHFSGERHHAARLTADKVRELRQLRGQGVLLKDLAARFGISIASAAKAANRENWREVA